MKMENLSTIFIKTKAYVIFVSYNLPKYFEETILFSIGFTLLHLELR